MYDDEIEYGDLDDGFPFLLLLPTLPMLLKLETRDSAEEHHLTCKHSLFFILHSHAQFARMQSITGHADPISVTSLSPQQPAWAITFNAAENVQTGADLADLAMIFRLVERSSLCVLRQASTPQYA